MAEEVTMLLFRNSGHGRKKIQDKGKKNLKTDKNLKNSNTGLVHDNTNPHEPPAPFFPSLCPLSFSQYFRFFPESTVDLQPFH